MRGAGRHQVALRMVVLTSAVLGCSSRTLDGGRDAPAHGPDVADGSADAGQDTATSLTCAPPPPNYTICPETPCLSATAPGCAELCYAAHCYLCRPDLTWQTVAVDCPVHDGGAGDRPAGSCVDDRDCPAGRSCGYPVVDRCAAVGVCVENNCPGATCITPGGSCGCDGQFAAPVRAERGPSSLQIQYTSRPYRGIGPCSPMGAGDGGP
jgi:hypothetical protein